jgi:hypothetical protein
VTSAASTATAVQDAGAKQSTCRCATVVDGRGDALHDAPRTALRADEVDTVRLRLSGVTPEHSRIAIPSHGP